MFSGSVTRCYKMILAVTLFQGNLVVVAASVAACWIHFTSYIGTARCSAAIVFIRDFLSRSTFVVLECFYIMPAQHYCITLSVN
jgi:hypothetical protein